MTGVQTCALPICSNADCVAATQSAFEQLTDCLDDSLIEEWTNKEQVAMEKCGDHLKIFTVTSDKCRSIPPFPFELTNVS